MRPGFSRSRPESGPACRCRSPTPAARPGIPAPRSRSASRITGCSPDEDLVVSWEGIRTDFPARSRRATVAAAGTRRGAAGAWRVPAAVGHRAGASALVQHRAGRRRCSSSRVRSSGPATARGHTLQPLPIPHSAARPGRFVLWRAAARMFAAQPLLGVGPDNFRLHVRRLRRSRQPRPARAQQQHVPRDAGRRRPRWRRWRSAGSSAAAAGVCVALARTAAARTPRRIGRPSWRPCVAIALHGLVDSFLGFTATYMLMAVTLGLAVACRSAERLSMRIAFDGTTLRPGRTGVGYYTEHLLHHLARPEAGDERRADRGVEPSGRHDAAAAGATCGWPCRRGAMPRMVWMQTLAPRLLRRLRPTSRTSPTA